MGYGEYRRGRGQDVCRAEARQSRYVKSKRKDEFEMPYVLLIYDMLKLANHRNDKKVLQQIAALISSVTGKRIDWEKIMVQAEVADGDLL